ncbi:TetR/AcrR family transcriptional regulator [Gorillibacterium timonense]|uniref:TetR/AcrR family transcriptional regulator n=1 Tax=Gorillibacterium timonense TaxID=1689269 RepID=UPI00071E2566|nr:TetR/AcrR family transcriptional regulator [Gorillibacterium timonense]
MTKREEQKEQRRNDILNAALDLFVKNGYGATRIVDIVERATISMGLLFHYFGSKEQLYHELIRKGYDTINFDLTGEGSPMTIFGGIAERIFKQLEEEPNTGKLFVLLGEALRNDSIPAASKELMAHIHLVDRSVPLIEKGQALGEIRQGDSLALALVFWDAIQGIAERVAVNPEMPSPEVNWILAILRKESSQEGEKP